MRVVWEKKEIPTSWQRAGEILIPKRKDSSEFGLFHPISLLNVERKIFVSVVTQKLLIDTSIQKAGISGFSDCVGHTSVIRHQIQVAMKEGIDFHMVFLDYTAVRPSLSHW